MGHAGSEYLDIQRRDSVRRQRRHALGREFAQRHRQQGPGRAVANDAAELAIVQRRHPQRRRAEHRQPIRKVRQVTTVHEEVEQLFVGSETRTPTSAGTADNLVAQAAAELSRRLLGGRIAAIRSGTVPSAEDRPHRGCGKRHDDHTHHHGDERFVIGEKLLHDKKSPSPGSRQSKLASANTDTGPDSMGEAGTDLPPQTTTPTTAKPNVWSRTGASRSLTAPRG